MGVEPAVFQSVSQKRAASSGTELFKRAWESPTSSVWEPVAIQRHCFANSPALASGLRFFPPKTKTPVHPKRLHRSLRVKMVIVK